MGSQISCWLVDVYPILLIFDGSGYGWFRVVTPTLGLCSSGQDTTVKGEGTRVIVHPVTPSVHGNQWFT